MMNFLMWLGILFLSSVVVTIVQKMVKCEVKGSAIGQAIVYIAIMAQGAIVLNYATKLLGI